MNRSHPATLVGLLVLFLAAAGITIAAFFSLIIPEFRHQAFYAGLVSSCIAELVLFGYLAYALGARSSPGHPDVANRVRLTLMVVIWSVVVIAAGAHAAAPANADTFASDKIILIELGLTFFLLAAVFFQHRQAAGLQIEDVAGQADRRRLECCAGGLDPLLDELRGLARRWPEHLAALDALGTRVDTLKTRLRAASATSEHVGGRLSEPIEVGAIEQRLLAVHEAVAAISAAPEQRQGEQLRKARAAVDEALSGLRQREDAMTF